MHPPGSGGYKHTPSSARAPPAHAPLLGRGGCSSFGHTLQPMDAHTGKKHSLHPQGVPPWDTIIPPQLGDEGHCICGAAPGTVSSGLILLVLLLSPYGTFSSLFYTSLQTTSFFFPNLLAPPWVLNLAEIGFKRMVLMVEMWGKGRERMSPDVDSSVAGCRGRRRVSG